MEREQRDDAKARLIAGLLQGRPWKEVAHQAGYPLKRSGAYRLLREVRMRGDDALRDGRHGHPAKMRGPARQWLADYCRGDPAVAGATVQAALQERFGLAVSVSQINRVRVALGVGRSAAGGGGGIRSRLTIREVGGRRGRAASCCWLRPRRQVASLRWRRRSRHTTRALPEHRRRVGACCR